MAQGVWKMNNCWHFLGSKDRRGYGRIGGRRACRVAYESFVGPLDNRSVLHRCDNPPCINPDHLYLGTSQDNMNDMVARDRNRYDNHAGSSNGNALLSEDAVEWIRANYQPSIGLFYMLHLEHCGDIS